MLFLRRRGPDRDPDRHELVGYINVGVSMTGGEVRLVLRPGLQLPHPLTVGMPPTEADALARALHHSALYLDPRSIEGATLSTPTLADSPAGSSITDRAGQLGYGRWLDHVSAAGGCTRPVRLTGQLHTIDTTTGTILNTRDTGSMPDGVIYVPCGDRRASVCPWCAETYRADTYQLIRAGLVGGKGVPDSVATHPAVFATLTAPSFGPVHARAVTRATGRSAPAACAATANRPRRPPRPLHRPPPRGLPRARQADEPRRYDHGAHVVWNAFAGELWRRTTITLAAPSGSSPRSST